MTKKTDDTIDLGALQREVDDAIAEQRGAEDAYWAASGARQAARERLASAFAALDDAVDKLKAGNR